MTDQNELAPDPRRVRLGFLDGIRGLAALYVLLFHSLTISVPQARTDAELTFAMRALRSIFGYGHFAVVVFIVLSGFSLMIPLARNSTSRLRDGFGAYMFRRCRRVLPPYYAALVLSIVAIGAATFVTASAEGTAEDALKPGSILSHLLLIHNLKSDWVYRINGPMWSVATEFQIYLLFPIVLLPLWRRIGGLATISFVWCTALVLHFSLSATQNFAWAAPWMAGSFALGMGGATIALLSGSGTPSLGTVAWGWIALGALVGLILMLNLGGGDTPLPILDGFVSVMAVALILACAARHERSSNLSPTLNRLLGSHPLVVLASFSYSLYLLQHPLLRLTEAFLGETSLGYEVVLWVQLLVFTPVIMGLSWIFAEFFELPFTSGSHLLRSVRLRGVFGAAPSLDPAALTRAEEPS